MTDTKHTPGPWRASVGSIIADKRGVIVLLPTANSVVRRATDSPDENAANLRLIAAAPDLLAAAENALCAYKLAGKGALENSTASQLRAAIAKARGGAA